MKMFAGLPVIPSWNLQNMVSFKLSTDPNGHRGLDDLRRKILDSDVVAALLARLEDEDQGVHWSALNVIPKLAQHGMLSCC